MQKKHTVLMTGAYPEWDMAALEAEYNVIKLWEHKSLETVLAECGHGVRAVATRGDLGANKALIDALPQLEMIGCFGVGTDGIDRTATRPRGIRIANTPDVLTEDVADLTFALILGVARQIAEGDRFVRDGSWAKGSLPLTARVNGKRLGIIGLGRIGKTIAKRASGFDMTVSYFGRQAQADVPYAFFSSLTKLAAASDFLVAIVPGGQGTTNLVTAEVLRALGPHGTFINVARGSVVDEAALLEALETNIIKAAALDVFWNEPNIDPRFAKLNNVLLHPHHGSGTVETRKAMGQLVRDNLAAFFDGRPLLTPVE
jgi:lactate dehydrogenase-like 2-hydroxyacid dehydrogenase